MTRRFATLCALAVCPTLVSLAQVAHASSDAEALKLDQDALYEDYLNLDFAAAQKKLNKAIELCQTACRPETKAKVLRDLGVIYVAGTQQRAEGVAKFAEALAVDPTITLDKDLTTPELEAAFAEAKGSPSASGDPALDAAMRGSVKPDEEEIPPAAPAEEAQPVLTEQPEEPKVEPEKEEPKSQQTHTRPVETDAEDCPPDFPGCNSVDNSGEDDEDKNDKGQKHWLTASFQADFLLLGAGQSVCAGVDYQCFRGVYYSDPSTNGVANNGVVEGAGDVKSGPVMGTMRALIGYDFAVLPELLIGARAGFAFGGGPERGGAGSKKFQPIHAELRGAYWFTGASEGTVRPFVELSGGLAEIDARMQARIIDQSPAQVQACEAMGSGSDPNCFVVDVDAWRKTGVGFVGAGLGAMFAVGDTHGVVVEARGMQMLGASATALAADIGYTFGL